MSLKRNNQISIALIYNLVFYIYTKYFDIQHYYIKDKVANSRINLQYMSILEIIIEKMIKALIYVKFYLFDK